MADAAALRLALAVFLGESSYRKFVEQAVRRARLAYWQEEAWSRFVTDHPEFAVSSDERSVALRVCHLHGDELRPDAAEVFQGHRDLAQWYVEARTRLFPHAAEDPVSTEGRVFTGDRISVWYCPSCRAARSEWVARRRSREDLVWDYRAAAQRPETTAVEEKYWPFPDLTPEVEWTEFDRDYYGFMRAAFAEGFRPREGRCSSVEADAPTGRAVCLVRRGFRNGWEPWLMEGDSCHRLGPVYSLPLGESACVCVRPPFRAAAHLALEWLRGRPLDSLLADFVFVGGYPAGIALRPEMDRPAPNGPAFAAEPARAPERGGG